MCFGSDTSPSSHSDQATPPSPPPPVVFSRHTDAVLRDIVLRLRERTATYKQKVVDPYATSPEISPPVSASLEHTHTYVKTHTHTHVNTPSEQIMHAQRGPHTHIPTSDLTNRTESLMTP